MGEFRYIPPDESAKRHRKASAKTPPRQSATATKQRDPAQKNVEIVLSLGDVRYFMFRSRAFRIPPVPYKLGQRALDLHIKILADAKQVVLTGERKPADAFYKKNSQMVKLLWTHIRPAGRVRRVLWRLGLIHNPFKSASEAEVRAITDFFLQGRMTSSVRSISETEAQA